MSEAAEPPAQPTDNERIARLEAQVRELTASLSEARDHIRAINMRGPARGER